MAVAVGPLLGPAALERARVVQIICEVGGAGGTVVLAACAHAEGAALLEAEVLDGSHRDHHG